MVLIEIGCFEYIHDKTTLISGIEEKLSNLQTNRPIYR